MSAIEVIVFDMDGVLIDAREWHYRALNMALAPFGMEIGLDAHLTTFDGLPTKVKLDMLTQSRGLPVGLTGLINTLKQRHTRALIAAHCKPVFHHRFLLSGLRREGYPTAVCSNSIRSTVDEMLAYADLAKYFAFTLSSDDVTHPKPAPDIYTEACRRFGVSPARCLVIEDNANGIAAARAAGTHVLEVSDPSQVTFERVMSEISSIATAGAQRC
jgi:beta-phosphoglucomutase